MDASSPEFKKKLLFGIALASGALALLMLYSYMSAQKEQSLRQIEAVKQQMQSRVPSAPREQMTSVLVAAREIKQGAVISASDIASREVPVEYVTPGAFPASANVIGLTALSPIVAGEQVLQSKVGQPEKPKLLSALTPPGKRAVSVAVDGSMAGLLQPGDYVDVLAIINPPEGSPLYALAVTSSDKSTSVSASKSDRLVTVPLFQNVLVLTIGAGGPQEKRERVYSPGKDEIVTLSLNPQEAALVAFVQEQGKIKLMMRSNSDVSDTEVQAVNWDTLFDHLYPGSRQHGVQKPATVEVYRGMQKEIVPLSLEGKNK